MTRYYNENPQVRNWMEKCAMLQQEIDIIRESSKENSERFRLTIKHWGDSFEEICNQRDKLKREMEQFNSLPWHKKMFFKFEI